MADSAGVSGCDAHHGFVADSGLGLLRANSWCYEAVCTILQTLLRRLYHIRVHLFCEVQFIFSIRGHYS